MTYLGSCDLKAPQDDELYTQAITTDQTRAAKIIGQDGYRIRKLKARRHVAIDTEYLAEDRTFIVKGTKENVKATIKEIQDLITSTVRADFEAKEPPRKKAVCRNYNTARGCRFGNNCHFLHTKDRPLDRSLLTSEDERTTSQSPYRSRSRDRSPLDRRDRSPRRQSPPRLRRDSRNEPPPTRHWEKRTVWCSDTQGTKGTSWYSMEPASYHPKDLKPSRPK